MIINGGIDQGDSTEDGEKWPDHGSTLKRKVAGFVDEMNVGCEEMGEVNGGLEAFVLNN